MTVSFEINRYPVLEQRGDVYAFTWQPDLKLSLELNALLPLSEALLGVALCLARQGDIYSVREIYELTWVRPRIRKSALNDRIAGKRIGELTDTVTSNDLDLIEERSSKADPWEEASKLLEGLSADGWKLGR